MAIAIVLSFAVCGVPFAIFTLLGKVSCDILHYYRIAQILVVQIVLLTLAFV